jgi:NAD(P)-dependent dehydrogenase (short-subunit alcohol dehydrogenase family)
MERMKARRWGRIINISSMAGIQGALYGHVHYAASKSGMLGFTKTLARTAAPHGITVNAVAPGITETELLLRTHGQEQIDELIAKIPVGGWSKPRHIGLAVAFLCGEAGEVITGATIDMNGGTYMR